MGKRRSCSNKQLSLLAIGTWCLFINLMNILPALDSKDFQDSLLDHKSFFQQPDGPSFSSSSSSSSLKIRRDDGQDVKRESFALRVVNLSDLNLDFPSPTPEEKCEPVTGNIERGTTTIIEDSDCIEEEWEENCEPVTMASGHRDRVSRFRPTCNSFHELDLVHAYKPLDGEGYRIEAVGQGSYRSAFKLSPVSQNNTAEDNFESEEILLKLFGGTHKKNEMNKSFLQSSQIDAFAMEALSSSKYVVDSFGYCGSSFMTEIANDTGSSIFEDNSFSMTDRLLIARDLARGLADLHTLVANVWGFQKMDTSHPLVFAHHDIKVDNIVRSRNGQLRWNDFNLGLINRKYIHQNNTSVIECPVRMEGNNALIRTPEELRDTKGNFFFTDTEGNGRNTASQAADIYSFGNILFTLLTQQDPWTFNRKYLSRLHIIKEKALGHLPKISERHLEEQGAKPLWEAIQKCYTLDPRGRPTAMELAKFLEKEHTKLLPPA